MSLQATDLLWSLCSQTSLLMIICTCSRSPAPASPPQLYLRSSGIRFFFFEFYFIYFFIQQVLISYAFYTYQCIHVNPNLPVHHTTSPPATFPPWCPYVCSLHLCLNFCPANWFICTIFLGSTYMRYYTILVFLFLTYFTLYDSL